MKIVVAMASRLVAAVELSFYSGIKDGFDIKKIVRLIVAGVSNTELGAAAVLMTRSVPLGSTWLTNTFSEIFFLKFSKIF